ncbi:hypothetical protein DSL64_15390 [Dyadobacter luteus]|uniref:beta-galactosidase n=1 Tax=Dyadobacter luteus TaxID=2259619 RepID=A0A3D8Y9C5_9BACT|nr:beta-galactosidase domain 4-containing protein [Dyadobacter luteus]REA60066.1 hypothetical protein DSL64_15390 [Dyadobacter luteus]
MRIFTLILGLILLTTFDKSVAQLYDTANVKLQIINPTLVLEHGGWDSAKDVIDLATYSRGYIWKSGTYSAKDINETVCISLNPASIRKQYKDTVIIFTSKKVFGIAKPEDLPPKLLTAHADELIHGKLVLWNAESPAWYLGKITPIIDNRKDQQDYEFYQSLSKFTVRNGLPFLNGRPVRLNTVRYKSTFSDKEKMIRDILALKSSNTNTAIVNRLDTSWLTLCDSLGFYTIMEHSLLPTATASGSFNEYVDIFSDDHNSGGYVPNIKFGSLIFFYVNSDDRSKVKKLNQDIPFFARYPNTFYGANDLPGVLTLKYETYLGDSTVNSNNNRKVLSNLQKIYRHIESELKAPEKGILTVTNNFSFRNIEGTIFRWKALNGHHLVEGSGTVPNLPAGESIAISLNFPKDTFSKSSTYSFEISFSPKNDTDFHGMKYITSPYYREYTAPDR